MSETITISDRITISPAHTHGHLDPVDGIVRDLYDDSIAAECTVCHQTVHVGWYDETGERVYEAALDA